MESVGADPLATLVRNLLTEWSSVRTELEHVERAEGGVYGHGTRAGRRPYHGQQG